MGLQWTQEHIAAVSWDFPTAMSDGGFEISQIPRGDQ